MGSEKQGIRRERGRIGVDIGGTNIKIGLVKDKKVREKKVIPTEKEPELAILRLCQAIEEMRGGEGVGVGCCGLIDHKEGVVRRPPNLPKWHNLPLKKILEERLGLPVVLGNDANSYALGEFYYGWGRGKRDIFVLTIGTGVGGGIIADGRLVLGGNFAAGEFGHTIIIPEGKRCPCGNRGCLERYIGQENIRMMAKRFLKESLDPKEVGERARSGEEKALMVVERLGYYLGLGLVNIAHLLDPELIVIGGGISKMGRVLLNATRRVVKKRLMRLEKRRLEIKISKLGPDAGILGATKFFEVLEDRR